MAPGVIALFRIAVVQRTALGRQGLAKCRVRPQDGASVHPLQRQPLRVHGRQGAAVRRRAVVDGCGHSRYRFRRRQDREVLRRDPGLGHRLGEAGVGSRVSRLDELGRDPGHRRRARLHGRDERPDFPRLARGHGGAVMAVHHRRCRSRWTASSTSASCPGGASTRHFSRVCSRISSAGQRTCRKAAWSGCSRSRSRRRAPPGPESII